MKNKIIDIIDIMLAVHRGELKIVIQNGFFLMENTKSGERVRLNEVNVECGQWENNEYGYQCSICRCDSLYNGFNYPVKSKFCPHCGKPMKH